MSVLPALPAIHKLAIAIAIAVSLSLMGSADPPPTAEPVPANTLTAGYHRLLPLEGGSNFRDFGGYRTKDGKMVVRGKLFRSAAMTALTKADQEYLNQFGFKTVVDLRSMEEIEVFPNHWARNQNINFISHEYSLAQNLSRWAAHVGTDESSDEVEDTESKPRKRKKSPEGYLKNPIALKPQLTAYFDQLLAGEAPVVVNCSAGQDRTGVATALVLTALGVPRDVIVEDYLLSTDYRDPSVEQPQEDFEKAPDDNIFKQFMLRFGADREAASKPKILKTSEGKPYLLYTFEKLEQDYGSVEAYLDQELGVSAEDVDRLKSLYVQ